MSAEKIPATKSTVIWVRCSDAAKLPALITLDEELQLDNQSIWLEMTMPRAQGEALAHPIGHKNIIKYCEELNPSAVLWVGGQFDPTTLTVCQSLSIPVIVIDAGIAMLPRMARGWFPGKTRALLSQLHTVFARTPDAANGLLRAGVSEDAIQISGSLEETGAVLACDEDKRYALAQHIGPRSIWLAADIDMTEAQHVATAHRHAALRAHRLLCIVTSRESAELIASAFKAENLNISLEDEGESIDDSTQVFIASGVENHGLWTRLSPITYVGGSLTSGARIDPFHIATVGSVVVHGHEKGAFALHFDRLIDAQATFVANRFDDLGPSISHLLSAEKAAKFAAAGWDVTSSGAELVTLLSQTLQAAVQTQSHTQ